MIPVRGGRAHVRTCVYAHDDKTYVYNVRTANARGQQCPHTRLYIRSRRRLQQYDIPFCGRLLFTREKIFRAIVSADTRQQQQQQRQQRSTACTTISTLSCLIVAHVYVVITARFHDLILFISCVQRRRTVAHSTHTRAHTHTNDNNTPKTTLATVYCIKNIHVCIILCA